MTIDYRARQQGRAVYLIAGQTDNHIMPHKPISKVRGGVLPSGISSPADLDFLDPANPFFVTDRALFSYGQFIRSSTPKGIFTPRPGVTILGDSGGFQLISNPALWQGNTTRINALEWLEANTNEAMTLDVPTRAIGNNPLFPDFNACLGTTLANNQFFNKHRTGNTRFLSVLQGRDRYEAITWLDTVRVLPFEGWAVGGDMRLDFLWLVELLTRLRALGLTGERNRLHVLGTSSLTQGVMLSAIQKSFAELPGEQDFQITFDTSNPSQVMVFGLMYGHPIITPDSGDTPGRFSHTTFKTPASADHSKNDPRSLPIKSSRISERLTIGDLCAEPAPGRNSAWDAIARSIVVNHNLDAMLSAFDEANSILEMPSAFAVQLAPSRIVTAYNVLRGAFRHKNPLGHVQRYRALFGSL